MGLLLQVRDKSEEILKHCGFRAVAWNLRFWVGYCRRPLPIGFHSMGPRFNFLNLGGATVTLSVWPRNFLTISGFK